MHRTILATLLALLGSTAWTQQFGGFPPSARWKQIRTDTARIIFQAPARAQAQRIATLVHRMAAQRPNALGNNLHPVSIVLHNNTTLANGYVALAPFRSEFYLIPGSNIFELGNLPWHEHLAVHEYRHVQQYNNLYRGFAKPLRFLLGQEGQALAGEAMAPPWFFEGDAVHAETALTQQGRGRLPYFLSGYNSLWQEGKNYRLMKLLNGSLKDYVPNQYQFGYLVTNYGYRKYGPRFWNNVIRDASSLKHFPFFFPSAVRHQSGERFRPFLRQALDEYKQQVKPETPRLQTTNNTVTNYHFPQYIGKDSLLYVKESYRSLPAFYLLAARGERRLKLRHISSEDWFSYRNGFVAYTAFATHPRWQLYDYSNIVVLDIKTGEEKTITRRGRYFTPDISPSGRGLAAVFITPATETELHLLDRETGQVLKRIPAPEGTFFLHPRFVDDRHLVLLHRLPDGTMTLNQWNLETEQWDTLLSAGRNTLGYPLVQKGSVFFTASASGNDELYALHLQDKKLVRFTSSQTGNYYACPFGDSLIWSKFTAEGLHWQTAAQKGVEVDPASFGRQAAPHPIGGTASDLLATPTRTFPTDRYRQTARFFNVHSWRPYYADPEFSFTVYSDNILNTFSNRLFYRYNQNERSHGVGWNTAYGGFFPLLTAGVAYTANRHLRSNQQTVVLDQAELSAGYSLPLDFSRGKTYKLLRTGSNAVYSHLMPQDKRLSNSSSVYLHHYLTWTQQLPRARQHIFPRWGYSLLPEYRHRLDEKGYQFNSSAQVFLPAFANHSLVLSGGFQQVDTGNLFFDNRFANARGYEDRFFYRMWRAGINYHFPIAYPDWGFGGLVYFLRIRANAFYDLSRLYAKNKINRYWQRSTGTEVFFDTRLFNRLPVSWGVRYSYLLDRELVRRGSRHVVDLVLPINLIPE